MKATKTHAEKVYRAFYATLNNLNGGTIEENKDNAEHCYSRLLEHVEVAKVLIANPGKRLLDDQSLLADLNNLEKRAADFAAKYGL